MTKNKKSNRASPAVATTECPTYEVWSQIVNWHDSIYRDWQPPVKGEPGCGTYREFLTLEGKSTYFSYCPHHGWQPISEKKKDQYAHTSKDCKVACHAQGHGLDFTPQNREIRKLLDLARKDVCAVAPRDDEKKGATKKEKVKTSGTNTNTKSCPIKNAKRATEAKVDKEDRRIVNPATIDGKKAILGFGRKYLSGATTS